VQEFASPPADGITLLLETLRGVQLAQSSPPNSGQTGPRIGTRRAALDELGCVECLAACGERCADASRLLVQAQPGLLALAVCLTSSLNRSRVLALQVTIVTSVREASRDTVKRRRTGNGRTRIQSRSSRGAILTPFRECPLSDDEASTSVLASCEILDAPSRDFLYKSLMRPFGVRVSM